MEPEWMARPLLRPVLRGFPHPPGSPPRSPGRSGVQARLLHPPGLAEGRETVPCLKGGRRGGGGNPRGEGLRPLRQKGESPLYTQAPGLRGLAGPSGRDAASGRGGSPGPRPPLCRRLHVPRAHQRQASVLPRGLLKVLANDGMELDTCVSFITNQKPLFPRGCLLTAQPTVICLLEQHKPHAVLKSRKCGRGTPEIHALFESLTLSQV